jgi:hypothetical protein
MVFASSIREDFVENDPAHSGGAIRNSSLFAMRALPEGRHCGS